MFFTLKFCLQRSFLMRLLQTTGLSLALMTASAAGVRADTLTVQGANGPNGASGINPGDPGDPGDPGWLGDRERGQRVSEYSHGVRRKRRGRRVWHRLLL